MGLLWISMDFYRFLQISTDVSRCSDGCLGFCEISCDSLQIFLGPLKIPKDFLRSLKDFSCFLRNSYDIPGFRKIGVWFREIFRHPWGSPVEILGNIESYEISRDIKRSREMLKNPRKFWESLRRPMKILRNPWKSLEITSHLAWFSSSGPAQAGRQKTVPQRMVQARPRPNGPSKAAPPRGEIHYFFVRWARKNGDGKSPLFPRLFLCFFLGRYADKKVLKTI